MTTTSLRERFAALQAERERSWDPAQLKLNADQRARLVAEAAHKRFVSPGDAVAPFVVQEVDRGSLTLDDLLSTGPAVLVFFRFAGCPACNLALPYYDTELAPGLRALGASLTAISPQDPARLRDIKDRHGLSFNVASDANELGRRFNLVFEASEASQAAMRARGISLGDITGTGTWELPQPAAIVIGQDKTVTFTAISPDWLIRSEAEPILAAAAALSPIRQVA
jgi:peroxiredoxin